LVNIRESLQCAGNQCADRGRCDADYRGDFLVPKTFLTHEEQLSIPNGKPLQNLPNSIHSLCPLHALIRQRTWRYQRWRGSEQPLPPLRFPRMVANQVHRYREKPGPDFTLWQRLLEQPNERLLSYVFRDISIAGQSVQIAEKRRIELLELRFEIHLALDPGISVQ
jgi:hypothetical protein